MNILDYSEVVSFFGLPLSTHRDKDLSGGAISYFQHEPLIAALSIFFFRTTVYTKNEPVFLRFFFAILLTCLSFSKKSYELIGAVELFSYAVSFLLQRRMAQQSKGAPPSLLYLLLYLVTSAGASFLLSRFVVTNELIRLGKLATPGFMKQFWKMLLPINELQAAYGIMREFSDPVVLHKQLSHLLFVTFHFQVGMGYLGIAFLTKEQHRRNLLIRMDIDDEHDSSRLNGSHNMHNAPDDVKLARSRRFARGAAPFILFAAMPYMLQIISYGNVNHFAFMCLQHDLHRRIRLNQLFDHESNLMAMANESPISPEAYASSMNNVVSTAYELFNRKLFSLPKVLLLPAVMTRQPLLIVSVFPFIFASDWLKATAVSYMTTKIEYLQKELQELKAVRSKMENFDMKNAELLQRSGKGATQFTQRRWEELTVRVQARAVVSELLSRSKGFFSFIQRNFVFTVLIDCALAHLIAIGKIVSSEIFVFSRAIEDAVDMALMRSRGEAEFARMMTEISRLRELADIWDRSKSRALLNCKIAPKESHAIVLRNLHYSRGTASVRADHIEIPSGIYALTGANGSGKSTLFRILMSCDTNEKSIDLPSSINLLTPADPLTEEDDIRRDKVCETPADADVDEIDMFEMGQRNVTASAEVDATGEILVDSSTFKSAASHPVPKLSVVMPSEHIVEISQSFYWPLYSRPIDWIFQEHVLQTCTRDELVKRLRRVAEELHLLEFFNSGSANSDNTNDSDSLASMQRESALEIIMRELEMVKEDWFSDLSGGQKSKVELVRKVFLQERCPDVLLIDETMAPLDPTSKALVMGRLKSFCQNSVVIVIYHTDVGRGLEDDAAVIGCIPSNNFFDKNLHLDRGLLHVRNTC